MRDLMLRRRTMTEKADPLTLYATNGLILWLDGIKNTANGHDANAQYWEDLSGNGHDYLYATQNIIHEAFLDINSQGSTLRTSISTAEQSAIRAGTVEIVYDAADSGTATVMFLPLGGGLNTISRKSGSILFAANVANKSIAITSGIHTYSSEMYKDGAVTANTGVAASWGHDYLNGLFTYSSSYNAQGNLYALRVYGRVLSETEIKKNFQADKVRFGIS